MNSTLRTELKSSSTTSRKTGLTQSNNQSGVPAAAGLLDPVLQSPAMVAVAHYAAVVES